MAPLAKALALLGAVSAAHALGQTSCVSFASSASAPFAVSANGAAAPVLVGADDWPGVFRAATDFAHDVKAVTGRAPSVQNVTAAVAAVASKTPPVIVGTLGKSALIDAVVQHAKLNLSAIEGKWEAYSSQIVQNPLPGIKSAYVIVGSDKRGTVYALYDHSEQFGVSPWYYWADVPVKTHSSLYVSDKGCSFGGPSVKYRGIFLNDEQPGLQNWAMAKFTNGTGSAATGSPFNADFYGKVFELLLRLRGNYLWPAMWSSAFALDDARNQPLADMYGVVMGTSHQEPMMRASPPEWNIVGGGTPWNYSSNADRIYKYWVDGAERARPYESLYTLGMRGAGDLPLDVGTNINLLEKVVADQRKILSTVYNMSDVSAVPQMWCLYKEVQDYFERGLRVPDDVTLLWTDDNWGNIRRLPLDGERNRTGGAGVYYHFDYVGDPRDYKWVQSTQLAKTYEQMSLALERGADRIWIVNVGDLKPNELNIEYFLGLGWDASKFSVGSVPDFIQRWAKREFGVDDAAAADVARIQSGLARLNARRKPELLNATTYALWDYREAERVVAEWTALEAASEKIYHSLGAKAKPAFFQLVHHPVAASATVGRMWAASGVNALRASQARISANTYADDVEDLFEKDWELEEQYHSLLDGKWDHMMEQTHIMYYYWQQPMANTMPPITRVQAKKQALPGPMRISLEGYQGAWPGDNPYQCAQGYNCPVPSLTIDRYLPQGSKYVDIGSGGPNPFTFTVKSNATWLQSSMSSSKVSKSAPEQRVELSVDWEQVGAGTNGTAQVTFTATTTKGLQPGIPGQPTMSFSVLVYAVHPSIPAGAKGFVEGDGSVTIEAAHASRNTSVGEVGWVEIADYGRTLSGVTPWPRMGNDGKNYTAGEGPSIEYDFVNFNTMDGTHVNVTLHVSPVLNANGNDRPLGVALQLDGGAAQTLRFVPLAPATTTPPGWAGPDGWVANSVIPVTAQLSAPPGQHTLKVWMVEPAVVLQRVVINTGGVRKSYLGPPESIQLK